MKHLLILIAAAGALFATANTFAQQPEVTPGAAPSASPPAKATNAPQRPEWMRMNIDFAGGSPAELLAAIKKVSNQTPNVLIHPDAATVTIPAFKLRDVSSAQIFIALNALSEPPFTNGYWKAAPLPDGEIWTLTRPHAYGPKIDPTTGFPVASKNCKILNLTLVLGDYSVDDVTTAMKGAWELLNSGETPVVKFHKDTKLLMIVGDDRQLNVANEVLRELTTNVELKRRDAIAKQNQQNSSKP
jgi:hypothetical protein